MASVNQVTLIGNVGKEPEIRTTSSGIKHASFSIAIKERGYKTKDGREIPERTEWVNVVAWRFLADTIEKYVRKGAQIYVQGKLHTRDYEKEGRKVYITEVEAETLQLLGSKFDNTAKSTASPQVEKATAMLQEAGLVAGGAENGGQELPF